MQTTVKKELKHRKTLSAKIKYLLFAYRFEVIVTAVVIFFVGFFTHSILVHDTAVLNVAIYTSAKNAPNSFQTSSTQGKLNQVLKINYHHHRNTSEVETGTTRKISDIAKLKAMEQAGQVDVLITSKNDFNMTKKQKKNYKPIPSKLINKVGKQNCFSYKGRILGVRADKLPIFNKIAAKQDIFCIPSNGKNYKERDKLLNYLVK